MAAAAAAVSVPPASSKENTNPSYRPAAHQPAALKTAAGRPTVGEGPRSRQTDDDGGPSRQQPKAKSKGLTAVTAKAAPHPDSVNKRQTNPKSQPQKKAKSAAS